MTESLTTPSRHPLAPLRQTGTVRARCAAVLKSVEDNLSGHFTLDRSQLPAVADRVAALTLRRFPDLQIPFHSRWRHFETGGVDRKAEMDARLAGRSVADIARARFDLTVLSVLLDAGAGPQWRYTESSEIDRMALPLQQRGSDELLALLDRVATGKPKAAAGAAAAVVAPPSQTAGAQTAGEDLAGAGAGAGGGEADTQARTVADPGTTDAPDTGPDATQESVADSTPAPEPAAAAPSEPEQPVALPPAPPLKGAVFTRSEGLAVASFRAFMAGAFSATANDPLRADAKALRAVDATALRAMFQSNPTNPLLGLEGRAGIVTRLGEAVAAEAGRSDLPARPALLYDLLTAGGTKTEVTATQVLSEVLRVLAPVWRSGSTVQGLAAGDVWAHRWAGAATAGGAHGATTDATTGGWVPFHKLSQWLAYSLLEPLQWAGVSVTGLDALTGLPEYRNGGLFIDAGVLVPRSPRSLQRTWKPGDEFVVEWRACTVMLLDELAELVRQRLGKSADELPLARILEGGTWAAGREIAAERRSDGSPPVKIDSDGTVF